MKTLDDKVVVITGAASGIGRALAIETAHRGAVLALSDVDSPGLQETARRVEHTSGRIPRVDKLDVRDREAWGEYAASVVADLGRVNALVNNAGVALSGEVLDVTDDQFSFVMDVDFWGVVHGTRAFLPHLIASGDGAVVNVSSIFGILAVAGQSAYNAAKFGVRGFTEALRQEMLVNGHPVAVTCVHPGGIKTAIARNAAVAGDIDQAGSAAFFDAHLARTTAEKAAEAIVEAMLAEKPRVLVGADAKLLDAFVRITGAGYQRAVARVAGRSVRRGR